MQKLRLAHLYLGCVFAPMLVFFSLSGVWQILDWQSVGKGQKPGVLAYLSTLHTGDHLRTANGATLSSSLFEGLTIVMTLVLIVTIVLGVVMAFRFGRGHSPLICLTVGVTVPVLIVLLR